MSKLYKIHIKGVSLALLFLMTQVLFAQEKPLFNRVKPDNKNSQFIREQPVMNEQNSINQSFNTQTSTQNFIQKFDSNQVPVSNSLPAGKQVNSSLSFSLRALSPEENVVAEMLPPLTFDCDGKPLGLEDEYGIEAGHALVVAPPGLLANDIDPDGDDIILSSITSPSNGSITAAVTSGSFTYEPDDGFAGTDQFTYLMSDVNGNFSDPVTVTIHVFEPFNRNPIGFSDEYATQAESPLVVSAPGPLANDTDPDGDDLIFSSITSPSHGSITAAVTSGSFTYEPDDGFTGTDLFTYLMSDVYGNFSDPVTVTIQVLEPFNRNPVGFNDHYVTMAETPLVVAAPGPLANDTDPDGDDLIFSSITSPSHGSITAAVTSGSFTYEPDAGFTGTDQFTYLMSDVNGNFSDPVTITIEVVDGVELPVGIEDEYAVEAGHSLVVAAPGPLANDFDPQGDDLIFSSITSPLHGSITAAVTSGSFTYEPDDGFIGTDQFTYLMSDVNGNFSDPVTITIHVLEPFNRNPIGISDHYVTLAETPLAVSAPGPLANDTDPDGDDIIFSSITSPSHGSITAAVTSGSFTYEPDAGFTGTDQFTYLMSDVNGNYSDPVTVYLVVIGYNNPPIANAANITTECTGPAGTAVILDGSSSYDPDDDVLQYTWYEDGFIIAGPSALPTAEVILSTGIHNITLTVEDECGNTDSDEATITIEDTFAPVVEAAFLPTDHPKEFEISCSSEDVCSEIVSSVSVIRIPDLINPSVSLKNHKNYSLEIDKEKNTVSVKAPDASAFWAMVLSNGGVEVNDGQVIGAKYDKNKYKFSFDSEGNLTSVEGNVVTLWCTATDEEGNTGESEATLPADFLESLTSELAMPSDLLKSGNSEVSDFAGDKPNVWHRNYPNPFNQKTTIEFNLENSAFVNISIFDQTGRTIEELESKQMPSGVHKIVWDAVQRKPGIYYYRIDLDGTQFSNKMILLRQ